MAFTAKIADIIADDKTGLLGKHDSWERIRLSDVVSILNGAPFDSARFNTTTGVALARIRDVLSGESATYYDGTYEDAFVLKQGDLLIGMDGDFHTGFWGAQKAVLNQRVCKLTPDEAYYEKKLLGYALPGYLAAINANTPSITVKHLSSKTIGEIELPLPPRAEQTRIVEKLESLLADLDAGVAELKAAQRKLAHYRQSLLKAAVEGALTADWRASRPSPCSQSEQGEVGRGSLLTRESTPPQPSPSPAAKGREQETGAQLLQRILRERRARFEKKHGNKKKYKEPAAPDTSQLPSLPEGWVWASLDSLLETIEAGKSFKCEERPPHDDEIGVVKVSAVTWGEYDEEESKTCLDGRLVHERLFVRAGDFLFSRANTIELVGACVIAQRAEKRVMLSDKILRFVFVEPSLDRLVLSLLRSKFGRKQIELLASGNQDSMRNIGQERIKQIAIPLPPLPEQHQILTQLDTALTTCKQQEAAIAHALKQAAAQRRNLLRAAFSGQLVPQDPADEPASALLERIRTARNDAQMPKRKKA